MQSAFLLNNKRLLLVKKQSFYFGYKNFSIRLVFLNQNILLGKIPVPSKFRCNLNNISVKKTFQHVPIYISSFFQNILRKNWRFLERIIPFKVTTHIPFDNVFIQTWLRSSNLITFYVPKPACIRSERFRNND